VKPVGVAVNVKLAPGNTAIGAPLIEALAATGVTEEPPAVLPAPAAGAGAVSSASRLAVGISSYEYKGVNTASEKKATGPGVSVWTLPIARISPPSDLSIGSVR